MMFRNSLICILLLLFSVNVASANSGETSNCEQAMKQYEKKGKASHKNPMKKILKKLDLTEEQSLAVKEIVSESKGVLKAQHKQVRELKKELDKISTAEELNQSELDRVSQALADSISQKAVLRKELKDKIFSVLTEEQQLKFEEIKSEMKKKGKKHKDKKAKKSKKCEEAKSCEA